MYYTIPENNLNYVKLDDVLVFKERCCCFCDYALKRDYVIREPVATSRVERSRNDARYPVCILIKIQGCNDGCCIINVDGCELGSEPDDVLDRRSALHHHRPDTGQPARRTPFRSGFRYSLDLRGTRTFLRSGLAQLGFHYLRRA